MCWGDVPAGHLQGLKKGPLGAPQASGIWIDILRQPFVQSWDLLCKSSKHSLFEYAVGVRCSPQTDMVVEEVSWSQQ